MTFKQLVEFFQAIAQQSSRIEITKILAELYRESTPVEAEHISYLLMGTLRPPYQGTQFNFAAKNIEKLLATLLQEDLEVTKQRIAQAGDPGLSLLSVTWPYRDRGLLVEQIYAELEKLEAISGTGSQEEKSSQLTLILKQVDALGACAVVRIVLGDLRLGFSDMTIIDGLSWMIAGDKSLHTQIENSYNLCADLGRIARMLKQQGIEGLSGVAPVIGIPIRPAAAERLESPQAIIDKIGPCAAQPKLDGFRLQIHLKKSAQQTSVSFFSRNLQDMSFMFPDLVADLKLLPVKELIAEGEAIVFDEENQAFLPFQETVKRKRKHNIEEVASSLPLKLFFFDVLYLDGVSLLSKPHSERREILVDLFGELGDTALQIDPERYVTNAHDLEAFFNDQISAGLEGLVVKRPDAPYQPGKRNFNWIKLKRHETGELDDTIDAVVLGYYLGKGKRTAFGIGAFLVGIYNPEADRFETIAKVGTGLKDADWIDLKKRSDTLAVGAKPHNVSCSKELEPDVWVAPEIVVVIRADEITKSPLHTAARTEQHLGFALRFPRFMGYSIDKQADQATTIKEIQELYQLQFAHLKKEGG